MGIQLKFLEESDFSISKIGLKDVKDISKLYHSSYIGKIKPIEYFKYRFGSTPYGEPITFGIKHKKKIVSIYAIHPIKLKIHNKTCLGGYSFLTMTDMKYQGIGLFTKLANHTFEQAKNQGYKFIYGFANSNSIYGFTKKLGFKEIKPINFIEIKKNQKKENIQFLNLKKNLQVTKIWNNYEEKNKFNVYVERNLDYLKWRFLKHPIFKYYLYHKPNNCMIFFKKHSDKLHIIDFFYNNKTFSMDEFISISQSACNKLKCDKISFWIPKKHEMNKMFNKKQKDIWNKSFLIVKPLDNKIEKSILDIKNWYYTMGDSDIF